MIAQLANESDLESVTALFAESFGDDADLYPISAAENLVVVKNGTRVTGAGAFFTSLLHTQIPRVAIAVDKSLRRHGIGRLIHNFLASTKPSTTGFDGCCFDNNISATSFFAKLGYRAYLDCVIPMVDATTGLAGFAIPPGLEVMPLELTKDDSSRKAILAILVDGYIRSHHWNPVALKKENPAWESLAFRGVNHELSLVARQGSKVVGASTARIDEGVLQIHWVFAHKSKPPQELEILKSLIATQLALAKTQGITTATFECDSTDQSMSLIPRDLNVLSSKTWRRFRYGQVPFGSTSHL